MAAVLELLALLDLRRPLVSLDALSCQPAIAEHITKQGGDYLLGLKANQPTLLTHVSQRLLAQPAEQAYSRWAFAGDDTPVHYQVWASGELGWVDEDGRWPSLCTLVRVQTTTQATVPVVMQRYYLSSRELTAAQADVRGHWAIKNALHWQLEVTFGEDDHYLRHQQAAQNLIPVRKMALNLLKPDPTKRSIKNKRKRLAWDELCLAAMLTVIRQSAT